MVEDKNTTKNNHAINKILKILRDNKCTPEIVRYIFKRVREEGNYQVAHVPKKLPDYLDDAEIGEILKISSNLDSTTRLLIPLAIFTGLRIGELTNIKIIDIDFNNFQLKVVQGKGKKDRYVPLNQYLCSMIRSHIDKRVRGNLFVKTNETPYTKRALQKKIQKVFVLSKLSKNLSAHSLRHTFGTLLRRKGMSLDKIQILMGHSKRSTTEIYAHLELAPVKEEYFKLIGF